MYGERTVREAKGEVTLLGWALFVAVAYVGVAVALLW